jgi:hypothetical protein
MESADVGLEDDLDMSWLNETEQLLDTKNYQTTRIQKIRIVFVFLNTKKEELFNESIMAELETPPKQTHSKLSKDKLCELIDTHRQSQYNVYSIALFHIPLSEENVQSFSLSVPEWKSADKYMKTIQENTDILLEPSVGILHELSSIYVFFREEMRNLPKSILKKENEIIISSNGNASSKSTTKKVRISCDEHVKHKTQNVAAVSNASMNKHSIVGRSTRKRR